MLKNKKLILTILALSLPAVIEMALNTMLGIADTIMLGQLINSQAIASVGLSNQVMYLLIFTFSAFNTGAVAMISRANGERDEKKLKHVAEQNVLLNLLIGTAVMVLSFVFRRQIFSIYDVEGSVLSDALVYFTVVVLGFIPMFLSFSYAAILRGAGDTKTPMKITGIANGLNIIGNYVLITGFGPFPELGILGAALSTTLSRVVATAIYMYILYKPDAPLKLLPSWRLDGSVFRPLFKISLPGGIEQSLMQLSFLVVGVFISRLSVASISVFRILIQIESLSFMPAVGISIAAASLVGKALGEKDPEKAYDVGMTASLLATLWGVLVAILFIVYPSPLILAFSREQEILTLALPVMLFLAINQPALNFVIAIGGALRGAGDTFTLMVITLLRLWVFFVPLSYVFIIAMDFKVAGLWYAEIISILIFSGVLYGRFKSKKWVNIKV